MEQNKIIEKVTFIADETIRFVKDIWHHPNTQSYKQRMQKRDPIALGGTAVVLAVVLWIAAGLFTTSKPSDRLIFEAITADGGYGEAYDIKMLRQDGYWENDTTYVAEVEYEILWKVDQDEALKIIMKHAAEEMKKEGMREYQIRVALVFGGLSVALAPLAGEKPIKAGDRRKRTEYYSFVKAESGWRLIDG